MQNIRKILRAVSEIFKDGPQTDGPTDGRTDMGDYIGSPRVKLGSKIIDKSLNITKSQNGSSAI